MEKINSAVLLFAYNSVHCNVIKSYCDDNNIQFSYLVPENCIKEDVEDNLKYLNYNNKLIVIYLGPENTKIFKDMGTTKRISFQELKDLVKEYFPNATFLTDIENIKYTFNII